MKIIDLLNKIANGEEVPKRIGYCGISYLIMEHKTDYYNDYYEDYFIGDVLRLDRLNDEVEILEEEKKIPEKLNIEQDTPSSNYYIRNENGTKCGLTKHSKMIAETLNQVIDYLKSKGE